jgi:hypothetical protein
LVLARTATTDSFVLDLHGGATLGAGGALLRGQDVTPRALVGLAQMCFERRESSIEGSDLIEAGLLSGRCRRACDPFGLQFFPCIGKLPAQIAVVADRRFAFGKRTRFALHRAIDLCLHGNEPLGHLLLELCAGGGLSHLPEMLGGLQHGLRNIWRRREGARILQAPAEPPEPGIEHRADRVG